MFGSRRRSHAQWILKRLSNYLDYSAPPLLERMAADAQKIHQKRLRRAPPFAECAMETKPIRSMLPYQWLMEWKAVAIRVVLGGVVGFGFVAPSVGAALEVLGMARPVAMLGGLLVGVGVFGLVLLRSERV